MHQKFSRFPKELVFIFFDLILQLNGRKVVQIALKSFKHTWEVMFSNLNIQAHRFIDT